MPAVSKVALRLVFLLYAAFVLALLMPAHIAIADSSETVSLGRLASDQRLSVSIVLPLRNQPALINLVSRLYDPNDLLYGKYLSPAQFADRFGPSLADVDTVAAFAQKSSLSLDTVSSNRTVLHLSGSSANLETAFGVHLYSFQRSDGTVYHVPDPQPVLPEALSAIAVGVLGLDNSFRPQHDMRMRPYDSPASPGDQPNAFYSTGASGLAPKDTQSIYNLKKASGSGQTLGLFEMDGWTPSDITEFETQYGMPTTLATLVSIDGGTGIPTSGAASETTLDIDMELALAPNASSILVYQAPGNNYGQQAIDIYNQMATDDTAKVISSSWGGTEQDQSLSFIDAEYQAFLQFAAQGQTMCASGGDSGAYNDQGNYPNTPTVSDPASDPFVLAVGGTYLNDTPEITYQSESSWADPQDKNNGPDGTGGGGGISDVWPLPSYQIGSFSTSVNPQGSTSMRNMPDVSLFADYNESGYSIYYTDPTGANPPEWYFANGTSASSPLWASFLANVNQARATKNLGTIGFASPAIYSVAENATKYAADFHDVNDGSNNLLYIAVDGFDNSTGWGSFNGAKLLADLAAIDKKTVPVSLYIDSNPAPAGTSTTAVLTLSDAAPAAGAKVKVVFDGKTLTPETVPSGSAGLSFSIAVGSKLTPGTYTCVATYNGASVSANVFVEAPIKVKSVTLLPKSIPDTGAWVGVTITLGAVAPSGGAPVVVTLSGSSVGTVTVSGGSTTVGFSVFVTATPGVYTFTAKYDGSSASAKLTVT